MKKLLLNKQVVAQIDDRSMTRIFGGASAPKVCLSDYGTCDSSPCNGETDGCSDLTCIGNTCIPNCPTCSNVTTGPTADTETIIPSEAIYTCHSQTPSCDFCSALVGNC
jgi:hypothetical protein